MSDFIRINAPRVKKAAAILALVHKSAKSQGVDPEEVFGLMGAIRNAAAGQSSSPPARPGDVDEPAPKPTTRADAPEVVLGWRGVQAYLGRMTYDRAIQLANTVPDDKVGIVMQHCLDRLRNMASTGAKEGER